MNDAPETNPGGESEPEPTLDTAAARDIDYAQARLAYQIIQRLLEHTRVTQDLVALMAQVLDESSVEALTQTPHWNAYMDSRRQMERTREDVEKFAEIWTKLADQTST